MAARSISTRRVRNPTGLRATAFGAMAAAVIAATTTAGNRGLKRGRRSIGRRPFCIWARAFALYFGAMVRFPAVIALLSCAASAQQLPADFVNPVKKTLKEGGVVIGATLQAANLDTMSIMANAGFDFIWIEGEHSP